MHSLSHGKNSVKMNYRVRFLGFYTKISHQATGFAKSKKMDSSKFEYSLQINDALGAVICWSGT